jgi:CheY-like chemotaxis protein
MPVASTATMMNILIVDDDDDDRVLLAEALNEIRPNVDCINAGNGEEALKFLRLKACSRPDIIFVDLNMPRFNGLQCLRELKKDEQLQNIPVIIYTTSKLHTDKEQALKTGACYFLTKPSSFKELCEILTEILNRTLNSTVIIENQK